jgi:hypothetical protein
MSFFENLSDDQLALLGSALAIVFCFGLLVITPGIRLWASQMTKQRPQTHPRFLSKNKQVPTH